MTTNAGSGSALEERITEECAKFRTGNVSHVDAIVNIVSLLQGSEICQGEEYFSTLRTYLAILDRHEEELRNSVPAETGSAHPAIDQQGQVEQLGPDIPETTHVQLGKRSRKSGRDSFSDGEDSEHGFDERDLPWFTSDKTKESQLPFNLQETRRLAIRYAAHPKRTKLSLLQSFDQPEFPDSEWDNLLRNRSVDIDRVLTHFTFVRNDEPLEFQVGSTCYRMTDFPILKVVSDHRTWIETWSRVINATSHLYPHRRTELTEYQTFISKTFLACKENPARVLLYDVAVRARVATRGDLLLTDHGQFQDLYLAYVINEYGVADFLERGRWVTALTNQQRPNPRRRYEICNKFNAGTCVYSDNACRYRHVCRSCRRSGHRERDVTCPKKINMGEL